MGKLRARAEEFTERQRVPVNGRIRRCLQSAQHCIDGLAAIFRTCKSDSRIQISKSIVQLSEREVCRMRRLKLAQNFVPRPSSRTSKRIATRDGKDVQRRIRQP